MRALFIVVNECDLNKTLCYDAYFCTHATLRLEYFEYVLKFRLV